MALPFGDTSGVRDARTLSILAKSIYRELRGNGFEACDVVALAGELLGQIASEVREERAASALEDQPSPDNSRGRKPV